MNENNDLPINYTQRSSSVTRRSSCTFSPIKKSDTLGKISRYKLKEISNYLIKKFYRFFKKYLKLKLGFLELIFTRDINGDWRFLYTKKAKHKKLTGKVKEVKLIYNEFCDVRRKIKKKESLKSSVDSLKDLQHQMRAVIQIDYLDTHDKIPISKLGDNFPTFIQKLKINAKKMPLIKHGRHSSLAEEELNRAASLLDLFAKPHKLT